MIFADRFNEGAPRPSLTPSASLCNVREGPCAAASKACACPGPHFDPAPGTTRVVLDAWPRNLTGEAERRKKERRRLRDERTHLYAERSEAIKALVDGGATMAAAKLDPSVVLLEAQIGAVEVQLEVRHPA